MGRSDRKYYISDEGKILMVNDDGSVTELGSIGDLPSAKPKQASVVNTATIRRNKFNLRNNYNWLWLWGGLFLIPLYFLGLRTALFPLTDILREYVLLFVSALYLLDWFLLQKYHAIWIRTLRGGIICYLGICIGISFINDYYHAELFMLVSESVSLLWLSIWFVLYLLSISNEHSVK